MSTAEVLKHRHMADEDTCRLCGARDTWRHALLTCSLSRSVWALAPDELVEKIICCQQEDPKEWLFAPYEILITEEFLRLVVTAWAIWGVIRKAIYEDIFQSPFATNSFIAGYLSEVQQANGRDLKPVLFQGHDNLRGYYHSRGVLKSMWMWLCQQEGDVELLVQSVETKMVFSLELQ
ncbi:hypothetical protein D1007_41544 [Hordeum vulgare]|nr:hypothetical protein D1007_41544 [Hordeum vulgare]